MKTAPAATGTLLWVADTDALGEAALAFYAGWLGASERYRCERFMRPQRRRQFIAGRALLRRMIAHLLGLAPADVALCERPGNAPALVGGGLPAVGFSMSHSGPWVACVASLDSPVGLDIERIDTARDILALAEQAFDPATAAAVRACTDGARVQAFYRHWCLLEAGIKLGQASAADHVYMHPGWVLAVRCARPLAAAPRLDFIRLGGGDAA
ncbi:4'-phosphopantetheinyl transferase family protein [Massilia luteola]|uniref:4'-phosphopantetheinyl transferase family protein n=1 Tax=Massilia luteola TaxID=3081751 RepID=UPI002ACC16F5|nr:4'-phosphopantetheinyl transferase superfamily protein [Massilia sp. Gc5]